MVLDATSDDLGTERAALKEAVPVHGDTVVGMTAYHAAGAVFSKMFGGCSAILFGVLRWQPSVRTSSKVLLHAGHHTQLSSSACGC